MSLSAEWDGGGGFFGINYYKNIFFVNKKNHANVASFLQNNIKI